MSSQEKLFEHLILPIPPNLHSFHFVRFYESVDLLTIFRYEHIISLGIYRFLKECLCIYLADPEKSSDALTYQSGTPEPFPVINIKALSGSAKQFHARIQNAKPRESLRD